MTKKAPKSAPTTQHPERLRLVRPYSFIDEAGQHRSWMPGHVVTAAADIALLLAHKAPVEVV